MKARVSCVFLLLAAMTPMLGSSEPELALQTEALVNLPRYVEWPSGAFVIPKTPLMLGIYGESKMHESVVRAADGKVLNGRIVMVRHFRWPEVPNCHALYIDPSERARWPLIMKKLEYSTVLTVADFEDFLSCGGMVRMSIKDQKVRFHVNTTNAKEAGLKFSSQFLNVAEEIIGEP